MRPIGRAGRSGGWLLVGSALAAFCAAGFAAGDPPAAQDALSPQAEAFFEAQVRPVLIRRCFDCHGPTQQMGGLRLDSRAALLKGGGRGPALVPGDPEKSHLIQAIRYGGALKMPPTGKLPANEIAALTAWVQMGAPWPATAVTHPAKTGPGGDYVLSEAQKRFWSFQPVRPPRLPAVKNKAWVRSPIDRFVLAKLEAKGLSPSPPADRATLIRRVTLDLTGLPPTPQEVDAFLADKSPDAYEKVVDRMLASPRYGERWGRHWLDVARYADTKGYVFTEDPVYHSAYTYRDYVIRAFNEDKPYDRFIQEQLAADLLPNADRRSLAALGFLTLGRRFLNDPALINDDRIDVTCRGLMGLTVACARCHDHKFDPIPQKDYYSLYGVFASSQESNPPVAITPQAQNDAYAAHQRRLDTARSALQTLVAAQCARLRPRAATLPAPVQEALAKVIDGKPVEEAVLAGLEPAFDAAAQAQLQARRQEIAGLEKSFPPAPEYAMALQDLPQPVEPHVFLRGNPANQGAAVPRQFLLILSGPDRRPFTQGSGRLELARDIASAQNPLTARVLVNRVWMFHFGAGLVRTPGDFGARGEPPTHPALLDWLAWRFMADGWSVKKLHRRVLLSSAYRQSSRSNPKGLAADPDNRLLWRQNRQRLDLEALRDSLLAVSGQLDTTMGGPSIELTSAPFSDRRTVYGYIDRQNLQSLYRTFDFASPDTSTPLRHQTTVPQQALFMMNSPFVIEQARHLAARPEIARLSGEAARIRAVYRLLFGRPPEAEELAWGEHFLRAASRVGVQPAAQIAPADRLTPWERYAQTLLMTNEFAFVD
ncbi:MAG TPA: PSD1 and planctomycete cytochrome C domain-containing protein [Chthonomonadaceae bacterium]|nr:PSD1 and planctomycete cytochrome C domain-containing protein [Chthonomonadaceae bacterium]